MSGLHHKSFYPFLTFRVHIPPKALSKLVTKKKNMLHCAIGNELGPRRTEIHHVHFDRLKHFHVRLTPYSILVHITCQTINLILPKFT